MDTVLIIESVERKSHSWGLGRLESAVELFLRGYDNGFAGFDMETEVGLLRAALLDVVTHCPNEG